MTTLNSKTITLEQLAKVIDHSLLRPEFTESDVIAGCELAHKNHTATICVKPSHVKLAVDVLKVPMLLSVPRWGFHMAVTVPN